MEYRYLGPTGLKVSLLSFGNMNQGDVTKQADYNQVIQKCWDYGINFFDTSENYNAGTSEIILGEAIKSLKVPREEIVVSTKVFYGKYGADALMKPNKIPNTWGLSRKHIIEGVKASLKRLQLDYSDIIFCHRYDHETPLEETCRAMNWLIDNGLTFYWGTSEWTAQQIQDAYTVCDRLGLARPVAEQCQYNMFTRQKMEIDYVPLFDKHRMGTTVWSPLAGGMLTGKYIDSIPEDSRVGTWGDIAKVFFFDPYMAGEKKEKTIGILKSLSEVASGLGGNLTQLALGWVLKSNDVSTAIIGASRVSQIDDDIKALEMAKKLTPDVLEKIELILGNKPAPGMNWKTFAPAASRR